MFNLMGPPITHADYQVHVQALSGLLHKVPFDDRLDLLNEGLARACARWDPSRSPWQPWIIRVLRGEVRDYYRDFRVGDSPLPEDLSGPDETPHLLSNIDLSLLIDRLPPHERLALAAREGGKLAHRARLRLRQIATQSPQQPRRCSDVS